MISNDILLYIEIGVKLNCHQRGFVQQLIETDAETRSQTLGRAQEMLLKRGIVGDRTLKENPNNQQTWTHKGSLRQS